MAEEKEKTLGELMNPHVDVQQAIVIPKIEAKSYAIDPGYVQIIVQDYQFGGNVDENPYHHLQSFLTICSLFKLQDVSDEAVRLLLFHFSLRDEAISWLLLLPANSITTWDDLVQKFLRRFDPPFQAAKMYNNATCFNQQPPQYEPKKTNNLKKLVTKHIADQERRNNESDDVIRNLQESVDNLEKQVGQISRRLAQGQVGGFEESNRQVY